MRGLILIILIVAGIYLLLHAVHTKKIVEETQRGTSGLNRTLIVQARSDLNTLADEIQSKAFSEGQLPSSLQEAFGRVPQDPWGNAIIYERENGGFKLISKGPDGIEGTDDDIVVER